MMHNNVTEVLICLSDSHVTSDTDNILNALSRPLFSETK